MPKTPETSGDLDMPVTAFVCRFGSLHGSMKWIGTSVSHRVRMEITTARSELFQILIGAARDALPLICRSQRDADQNCAGATTRTKPAIVMEPWFGKP